MFAAGRLHIVCKPRLAWQPCSALRILGADFSRLLVCCTMVSPCHGSAGVSLCCPYMSLYAYLGMQPFPANCIEPASYALCRLSWCMPGLLESGMTWLRQDLVGTQHGLPGLNVKLEQTVGPAFSRAQCWLSMLFAHACICVLFPLARSNGTSHHPSPLQLRGVLEQNCLCVGSAMSSQDAAVGLHTASNPLVSPAAGTGTLWLGAKR